MLRYAPAIFLSAFLLFQVQPLISKWILPWFGGSPAVWTTAMLFFQVLLLPGAELCRQAQADVGGYLRASRNFYGVLRVEERSKGDEYRFYEINPEVERIATSHFTYLRDSAADCRVVLGDARLSLEAEESHGFHVLVLDAFSGDAIPVHLLTREAFATWLRQLDPQGVIAVHVANRHLDLTPVLLGAARHFGLGLAVIKRPGDPSRAADNSVWVLLTRNTPLLRDPAIREAVAETPPAEPRAILWTDDYSDLFRILK